MNVSTLGKVARTANAALLLAALLAGCKSTPPADDASVTKQVQSRLSSDSSLTGEPVQASVASGVVTLNGTVDTDAARSAAAADAAQVAGVHTVVNNLVVQPPPVQAAVPQTLTPQTPPAPARETREEREKAKKEARREQQATAPVVRNAPLPPLEQPQPSAPPQVAQVLPAPPPPPPPPQPVVHTITLPADTAIPVRITETLDSKTTQTGDKFTGVIASDIVVDGMVVLPQGTPVTGHVDAAQDAAHFKGSALLTISLSSINRRGERIDVATEPYTKQGEGRGKNTAEKVGGGAAVGAILGGILGGGKGAAIGAAAGGGVGAGANGVIRGQQVQIPSETVVRFKLSDAIIVHVTTGGSSNSGSGPSLEHHND